MLLRLLLLPPVVSNFTFENEDANDGDGNDASDDDDDGDASSTDEMST